MTDRCKNITLATTSLRPVITRMEYFAHANCPIAVFFEVLRYGGVVASNFPPVRH